MTSDAPTLVVVDILKPEGAKYLSLGECFVSNAMRHERRAQHWREQGREDFAQGSERKAARNFNFAWDLGERKWNGAGSAREDLMMQVLGPALAGLERGIAEALMQGVDASFLTRRLLGD